jgi:hypothetical protein
MNVHARVVREVLKRLYSQIQSPLASDRERLRIGLKAVDQLDPPKSYNLSGLTVAQVQAAVEGKRVSAAEALAHEHANMKRKGLTAWLEERTK